MDQDKKDLKKAVMEHSDKLAALGMQLGQIRFSYKVEKKPSKKYWEKRIKDFKRYNEKGAEYYHQAYLLMRLVNNEESQMFLLHASKFHQLGLTLIEIMEKIKENPSIINPKDMQQSQWSREIKEQITKHSNRCLDHEKDMNTSFREFYERHLKKVLDGGD